MCGGYVIQQLYWIYHDAHPPRSIAGLLTARVCADHFSGVIIVDSETWLVAEEGIRDHDRQQGVDYTASRKRSPMPQCMFNNLLVLLHCANHLPILIVNLRAVVDCEFLLTPNIRAARINELAVSLLVILDYRSGIPLPPSGLCL